MTATTRIAHVHTVGVPVSDQDKALEFYVDRLGLEIRMDASFAPGQRWVEVAPADAVTSIALLPASDAVPAGRDTGIRLATDDAAAEHRALGSRGVTVDELLRWEGVPPMFALRDQDDNVLYVVEST